MRLLNSVCKVIADAYSGVPVYIQEVPREFERPSFFVSKITDPKTIKNYFSTIQKGVMVRRRKVLPCTELPSMLWRRSSSP